MDVVQLCRELFWDPRGSHLYFRLGGFQVEEELSAGDGERPDQTRHSPPFSIPPLLLGPPSPIPSFFKDSTGTECWSSVGREEKQKGDEGARCLQAQFGEIAFSAAFWISLSDLCRGRESGEVPRPQALVAFCIHFSGFETGSNLGA